MNPERQKIEKIYKLNEASFLSDQEIKNSPVIGQILRPFQSFIQDQKHGQQNYNDYINEQSYISYVSVCLKRVLGFLNKKNLSATLPDNMKQLIDYCTLEGTSINNIQNAVLENLFKFGLAGILVKIPDGVQLSESTPLLDVIKGKDILDYQIKISQKGFEQYKWLAFDTSRWIFDRSKANNYFFKNLITIHGLDQSNEYYICEIDQTAFSTFDFEDPESSGYNVVYPEWHRRLNFVPFVQISNRNNKIIFGDSFIQDLIDCSLQIFKLSAKQGWLFRNSTASHLFIRTQNTDMLRYYSTWS